MGHLALGASCRCSLSNTLGHAPLRGLHTVDDPLRQHIRPLVHGLVSHTDCGGGGGYRPAQQVYGFGLEHTQLNHSSAQMATIVHGGTGTLSTMVEDDTYAARLKLAMDAAGVDNEALRKRLGITVQAVRKILGSSTGQFTAKNNSQAAEFLGVDPDWLATGKAVVRPQAPRLSAELLAALARASPEQARRAENAARACLDMDALGRDSAPPEPFAKQPRASAA